MTLNDLERRNSPYFAFFSPNSIASQADCVTVVEDRPIMSVKYCLPVPVFHFWPKLTHPAARSLCNSWATCVVVCMLLSDYICVATSKFSANFGHVTISVIMVLMCGKRSGQVASHLLQVKMNVIPYDTCRRMHESDDLINNTVHICVGSVPTEDVGICKVI